MKIFLFLSVILLGIHETKTATHSLQYFYTGSSGIRNFPEFVTVGMVDGQPFSYYDSVIKKEIPKQDWIAKNEGPEYWERNTQKSIGDEQNFKANIDIVKQRFNQTGGVHIVQWMYGCEWDDETGKVNGFHQYGYDGEDFIAFDPKTETWITPKPQGLITKQKWDTDRARTASWIDYVTVQCPDWLKKYVNYGKTSLLRTELPSVSILQKPSSSMIRCHATGFYPNRAEMFWRKDGEEIHEGVEKGEILPNNNGTFQMTSNLKLSSETSEDWMKYECVFQLSGVKEDIITRLEKTDFPTAVVIGVVVVLLILAVVVGVGVWYKRRQSNGFEKANSSDTSSNPSMDKDSNKETDEKKKMMDA
ncbi:major histocompatibility complex class I-related gene protein-like isoform X2 [Melanotaenia boesemani]|uniref:major histocompatibility complex class I-related gene protein-like isoform X2 n=1 Tax=Melanotaenia boesemani TaxID=1250792 RepID=UPI001C050800|nr:major histocompatibility complex class I-related gene protein-like isoform X2 [Melanotaenia boesemani]